MKNSVITFISLLLVFGLVSVTHAVGKVSPTSVSGATTVTAAEAKALFDKGAAFIDTRKDKDWNAGRIPDAIHLNVKKDLTEASLGKEVKKTEAVVMYCNGESCLRSAKGAEMAVGWGYSKVYYFRDGFPAWKAAGYPVE